MMFDYLFTRRVPIRYVAPPICEYDFSGTGEPTIYLAPIPVLGTPSGPVFGVRGANILSWDSYPGAICYTVYRSVDEEDPYGLYEIVAECIPDNWIDLEDEDDGWYRIEPITPDGAAPLSPPVDVDRAPPTPPPTPECPDETGDPCPTGPDAFDAEPERGEFYDPVLCPLLTTISEDNPIVWDEFEWDATEFPDWPAPGFGFSAGDAPGDYPPGYYQIRYISGAPLWDPVGCSGPPPPGFGGMGIYFVGDDEHYGVFGPPNGFICNNRVDLSRQCPPAYPRNIVWGGGVSYCAVDPADLQNQLDAFHHPANEEKTWMHDEEHSNTGGNLKIVWITAYGTWSPPVGFEPMLQVLQVGGLRQQPRQIRVTGWATVKWLFPAQINTNWNGDFDTRADYTKITARWEAPASGAFGGAIVRYSQTHPTALNGCGWIVDIYIGGTIHWTGYKVIGDRPDGLYHRSSGSPASPRCIRIENKTIWEYPGP